MGWEGEGSDDGPSVDVIQNVSPWFTFQSCALRQSKWSFIVCTIIEKTLQYWLNHVNKNEKKNTFGFW